MPWLCRLREIPEIDFSTNWIYFSKIPRGGTKKIRRGPILKTSPLAPDVRSVGHVIIEIINLIYNHLLMNSRIMIPGSTSSQYVSCEVMSRLREKSVTSVLLQPVTSVTVGFTPAVTCRLRVLGIRKITGGSREKKSAANSRDGSCSCAHVETRDMARAWHREQGHFASKRHGLCWTYVMLPMHCNARTEECKLTVEREAAHAYVGALQGHSKQEA